MVLVPHELPLSCAQPLGHWTGRRHGLSQRTDVHTSHILRLRTSAPHEGDGPMAVAHKVMGRSGSRKDQLAACPLEVRVVKRGI